MGGQGVLLRGKLKKETLAKQLARKVVPRDLWPQYSRHLHVKFKADQIVYLVQNIAIKSIKRGTDTILLILR